MEIYVNFWPNMSPTIGVWWKKLTYNRCVVGKLCSLFAKLASYDSCAVVVNGHITTRNEPTIGVWWKYMSISGQICHYNRCVVQ